ncbi:MAG TPA: HEAT repeat domain-containing protein [Acidobacteriota bacterium]|jgi:HEAT repeat protein
MEMSRKALQERVLVLVFLVAASLAVSPARAQDTAGQSLKIAALAETERSAITEEQQSREDELYARGTKALDERQWDTAIAAFDQVANMSARRPDGALYWKAYALNKAGRRPEALAAVESLRGKFPRSRWMDDAKALEVEIRQAAGQAVPPESESDEELKLMALNGLVGSDPERAVPMLEKFVQGSHSPKLKKRALFVLSQSGSARAKEVVSAIARGKYSPELQMEAIQSLGLFGGRESRQALAEIYSSSSDAKVKRAILRSFMVAGERDRLLAAARDEKDADLRGEAVNQLGVMGAHAELWDLYQKESSHDIKKKILQAMFVGGNVDKLAELARTEKDLELRRAAIRNLGLMGSQRTAEILISLYTSDKDLSVRKEAINALFLQGNAKALVDLARKEADPALKKEIINRLSLMRSKEAVDYLMEILNK